MGTKRVEPKFVVKVSIKAGVAMGPGKAALLEAIQAHGSISGAARALEMSYSRAWLLVRSMNEQFQAPLVDVGRGGASRGGAVVTALGAKALQKYRDMHAAADAAIARHTKGFERLLR
ncbi:LysR family transcriptional regulator [Ramlibacter sp. AN1015]|uniref:winged helix-turn-helix domain-containing protein n=1 Tax=Ramlibacter sp. AN1015 TaxID=3133428 RepID=UPI0030C548A8